MKTTQYLYGVNPTEFTHLMYTEALQFKINSAKQLLVILLKEGYLNGDHTRVNQVSKAIKFNKELLEEAGC